MTHMVGRKETEIYFIQGKLPLNLVFECFPFMRRQFCEGVGTEESSFV